MVNYDLPFPVVSNNLCVFKFFSSNHMTKLVSSLENNVKMTFVLISMCWSGFTSSNARLLFSQLSTSVSGCA